MTITRGGPRYSLFQYLLTSFTQYEGRSVGIQVAYKNIEPNIIKVLLSLSPDPCYTSFPETFNMPLVYN